MATTIGAGDFRYEYQPDWARLLSGMSLQGPSGVAVDSHDRVYVFQRQGPCVVVFDPNGEVSGAWPRREGVPADAHHIHVGPDDTVYLTDRDAHQVLLYDTSGNLLQSLGTRDHAAMQAPFNHPADVCVAPSGELYVADGYGNSSLHRFSATLDYISSFGSPGSGPGQFRVPHSVRVFRRRAGLRCRQGEPPGAGVLIRRGIRHPVDRLQVPHGGPHRRQPGGIRH